MLKFRHRWVSKIVKPFGKQATLTRAASKIRGPKHHRTHVVISMKFWKNNDSKGPGVNTSMSQKTVEGIYLFLEFFGSVLEFFG